MLDDSALEVDEGGDPAPAAQPIQTSGASMAPWSGNRQVGPVWPGVGLG